MSLPNFNFLTFHSLLFFPLVRMNLAGDLFPLIFLEELLVCWTGDFLTDLSMRLKLSPKSIPARKSNSSEGQDLKFERL